MWMIIYYIYKPFFLFLCCCTLLLLRRPASSSFASCRTAHTPFVARRAFALRDQLCALIHAPTIFRRNKTIHRRHGVLDDP